MTTPESTSYVSVIEAVRSPLGFFTLIALILDGALIAAAAATEEVSLLLPLLLLALLVLIVAGIAVWRPHSLYPPTGASLLVTLIFPNGVTDVDLVRESCVLEVRDARGKTVRSTPDLFWAVSGYWALRLRDVDETHTVRLELVDSIGRRWNVRAFLPYASTQPVLAGHA